MARYIDADKLIKDYTDIFTEYGIELAEQFQGVINQSPTAGVVERSKIDKAIEEMERNSTCADYEGKKETSKAIDINCII